MEPGITQPHSTETPRPPGRVGSAARAILRARITAGLITIIPIWVTFELVRWLFNFVSGAMTSFTKPIASRVADALAHSPRPIVAETVEQWSEYVTMTLAFLITLSLLYLLGLASANVVGRRFLDLIERVFARLPLVKSIYKSTKQVVMLLGGSQAMQFKRVVLVEFPRPGMKCIGFLTAVMEDIDTGRQMASIFISTTPNPTTGYMQIVPLDEVSETHWTVEEAVKLLMSGGILSPAKVPFDKIHPVHWPAKQEEPKEQNQTAIPDSQRK